jgi:hypothetical protein
MHSAFAPFSQVAVAISVVDSVFLAALGRSIACYRLFFHPFQKYRTNDSCTAHQILASEHLLRWGDFPRRARVAQAMVTLCGSVRISVLIWLFGPDLLAQILASGYKVKNKSSGNSSHGVSYAGPNELSFANAKQSRPFIPPKLIWQRRRGSRP